MERHELVMAERPYWRTILHDGGPGPMIVAVEETTYAEINGRTARKELSVYDAMLAEIYAERNKAKARRVRKPDARTREQRLADWNAEKERRKDRRIDAKCNHINKKYGYLCIEQERRISAEKIARADFDLAQENDLKYVENVETLRKLCNMAVRDEDFDMYDYTLWQKIRAIDLPEETEKFLSDERNRVAMRKLNDWLKYA